MSVSFVEILLVEDNPRDAELTLRALRRRNLASHAWHVHDGQEAIDFLFAQGAYAGRDSTQCPRLILLDLKLPRIDGLDVLRRIKLDPLTHLIPVVVLSSSREDRDVIETYSLGINSYIVKPVEFEHFSDAISSVGSYWLQLNQAPIARC